jgi:hypothetical protein
VIETQGDNAGVIWEGVNHHPGSRFLRVGRRGEAWLRHYAERLPNF